MSELLDTKACGATRLKDKVCVVTGSGQGIGRAIAKRLGQEGGKILIVDRIDEGATRTVNELKESGVDARKNLGDVSTLAGAKGVMDAALEAFGRIDVLVNNVGGTIWWQRFHEYTEEQVHRELERSLYPTLWCCLAVLPIMMKQRSGAIVNLGSESKNGPLYRAPYFVSKGGIAALTRVLSTEYGEFGIRVNAVSPGAIQVTDRIAPRLLIKPGVMAEPSQGHEKYYREAASGTGGHAAINRRGLPEEEAATVAFLASDDASFITGQVISCTGGP
jgi:NAD(P)-dependent dehydrogenase (short-subunit alcohol dehydrogenase family)